MSEDLNWRPATELTKLYQARGASPVEVAKGCLARISALEPTLNAMSLVDQATALEMAQASEKRWIRGEPLSPLDGVPILVKDLLLVKGWPTRRGSRTVNPDQPWLHDAPCVARLREAGCVFIGMTTTPEFGWKGVTDSPLTGVTRNPWDPSKTPGGSSGGSAAGLAAGYAPLALGTDGGGSIRIPASFSGVYGLKPSFGRVPAWPLSPFGTVAHVGPMARSVADAALMLNIISRPDARDWYGLPYDPTDHAGAAKRGVDGMVLAYSPRLGFDVAVAPDVEALVRAAVQRLEQAGARVVEIDPGFKDPADTFRVIWWLGVRAAFGQMAADKLALLEPALRDVYEQSLDITVEQSLEATRQRGQLGSEMRQFMAGFDALLLPTMPDTAFEAGQLQPGLADPRGKWVNWTPFTYPFNLTQQPAASIPCGVDRHGLPVGLQIVGRMFDDVTVLRISAAIEAYGTGIRMPSEGWQSR